MPARSPMCGAGSMETVFPPDSAQPLSTEVVQRTLSIPRQRIEK